MTPTRHMTRATLTALFAQAVRAIGQYEVQRKAALLAIESQGEGAGREGKAADAISQSPRARSGARQLFKAWRGLPG